MLFGTQLKKEKFFSKLPVTATNLNVYLIIQWGMQQKQQKKHSEHCWLVKLTHTRVGS